MKLALATLLLTSMASLPYAAARVGQKTLKLKSKKPLDPKKGHLAFKPSLKETTEEQRIYGGEVAEPGEFPFYAGWIGLGFLCGGSLIHEDIILTAAHCNEFFSPDEIYVGTDSLYSMGENEETHVIETRRVHPNYDPFTSVNDVMVLKITSPSSLLPVALNDDSASPSVGEDIVAIGLGIADDGHFSDVLRKVTLPTIDTEQCAADYDWLWYSVEEDVTLCAGPQEGGKGSSKGDSGGPVLELRDGEYVQVGINSWSVPPDLPDVYTRVSGVKSWVDETICELSDNPPTSCGATTPPTSQPSSPKPTPSSP